jgi:hypothetical protein
MNLRDTALDLLADAHELEMLADILGDADCYNDARKQWRRAFEAAGDVGLDFLEHQAVRFGWSIVDLNELLSE